ncbi:protein PHLOEM PROTEIN 2-LIKE A10-like [Salvia miltiorrhiza]|uniref:protein PHLOEM PROTEIN 2-LIKE A10-like n=1 Tax=Salvia miltiorrhiza TaxID=226208 RepID=UPI0025ACD682|nr:protein PHLOEM PROTEIN 2-LIKE A10-like [Salvia miltiorrhiza]
MGLELLEKGLDYAKKKRKWAFVVGLTCYGVHKLYNFPCVVKRRQSLSKFLAAFTSVAEMVSDSADALGILSKDLKQFLASDSDQIPQSLKQLSKIANSNEFSDTLTTITRASAVGILSGYHHDSAKGGDHGFSDRVMDKLFSDAGAGFASAVVGSFARNTVMALFLEWQSNADAAKGSVPWWIELVCEENCRALVGDMIRVFVSTAVTAYLEKTMNVNAYEEFFAGLTNPKHQGRVRELLVCVCNNAVDTCVRTSYHAWRSNSAAVSKPHLGGDEKGGVRAWQLIRRNQESGWMRAMRVPANRKLVLDATGVATFEGVRSFLEVVLEKVEESVKMSVDVVQQEVVEKGVEAVRYASGRSSAFTALCLTLCFNILNSPWIFTPYT